MKEKRIVRKICGNCKLYNPEEGVCGITVLHEGEYLELQVRPNDRCWWEKMSHELSMIDGEATEVPIQQIHVTYDLDSEKIKIEAPMSPPNPLA